MLAEKACQISIWQIALVLSKIVQNVLSTKFKSFLSKFQAVNFVFGEQNSPKFAPCSQTKSVNALQKLVTQSLKWCLCEGMTLQIEMSPMITTQGG